MIIASYKKLRNYNIVQPYEEIESIASELLMPEKQYAVSGGTFYENITFNKLKISGLILNMV